MSVLGNLCDKEQNICANIAILQSYLVQMSLQLII